MSTGPGREQHGVHFGQTLCTERPNTLPLELLQVESLQSAIRTILQNCKCMDSTASLLRLGTFAINAEKSKAQGPNFATDVRWCALAVKMVECKHADFQCSSLRRSAKHFQFYSDRSTGMSWPLHKDDTHKRETVALFTSVTCENHMYASRP